VRSAIRFSILSILLFVLFPAVRVSAQITIGNAADVQNSTKGNQYITSTHEAINLLSGELSYNYVDLDIPGPNGLNVQLSRRYTTKSNAEGLVVFGNAKWMLELPMAIAISYGGSNTSYGCWQGEYVSISFPGQRDLRSVGYASANDLPSGVSGAFNDNSIALCGSEKVIKRPDGVSYHFDKVFNYSSGSVTLLAAFVSKIKDRFGNEIQYIYTDKRITDGSGYIDFPYLTKIITADNKAINLIYDDTSFYLPVLKKITFSGREIKYNYDSDGALQSVDNFSSGLTQYTYKNAAGVSGVGGAKLLDVVKTPKGASVSYEYGAYSNAASANCLSQRSCPATTCQYAGGYFLGCFETFVTSKTVSGQDVPTQVVNYSRDWSGVGKVASVVTEQNAIDGGDRVSEYEFLRVPRTSANSSSGYSVLDGKLSSRSISVNSDIYVKYDYAWGYKKWGNIGCQKPSSSNNVYLECARPQLNSKKSTFYYNTGTDVFNEQFQSYDKYGYAYQKRSYNNYSSASKYERQTLINHISNWVLGLPYEYLVSRNGVDWKSVQKYTYHGPTSNYQSKVAYDYQYGGLVKESSQYYFNGELKRVDYAGSNFYEEFNNYKAGIPQEIKVPDKYNSAVSNSKEITLNNFGEVMESLDFNGNRIQYKRNPYYGAVYSIEEGDWFWPKLWTNTARSFSTEITGDYRKDIYRDALGGVKQIVERDIYPGRNTVIYKEFEYDSLGNLIF